MLNTPKLKAKIILEELTMAAVAEYLNVNVATLYRKISGESDFTRSEIQKLRKLLKLSMCETVEIFFA